MRGTHFREQKLHPCKSQLRSENGRVFKSVEGGKSKFGFQVTK